MPENPYGLSPQDVQDLRDIATHLPAGDPRMAKVSLLLNSVPTQFEQERDPANQKGFLSSATSEIGNAIKSIPSMLTPHMPTTGIVDAMSKPIQVISENAKRKQEGYSAPYRALAGAVSTALPVANVNEMEKQADVGNARGVLGTAAGDAAMAAAPEALKAVRAAVPSARGVMAARMAEVPAGEQFSRGEVLDAARQHGVNLDLAQATDSGVAKAVKKANQYSLTGQGAYEANAKSNLSALEDWANSEASSYAKESSAPEVVGKKMQESLVKVLDAKKTAARQMYSDLDSSAPSKIDVTGAVQAEAQKIIDANKDYYAAHPELKPKQAWGILEDLAQRPVEKPATPGQAGFTGKSPAGEQLAANKSMSWSELHQLRSDLMDFYRNTPDVVKGRSEAWIQQMVGKIDSAMTDSANGLSGADLAKFRQANATWESIKSTFDNPQHPFYHAMRAQFTSQVPGMLAKSTPELARQVRETIGSLEGPFQRQFVENLLYAKDGQTLELGRLNQKLKGISNEHLEAMIGEDGAKNLRMLAKVAQKVVADQNPSGTAKVGQPAAELAGLFTHPAAAVPELGAQYLGAKAINSPRVLDYLTRPKI